MKMLSRGSCKYLSLPLAFNSFHYMQSLAEADENVLQVLDPKVRWIRSVQYFISICPVIAVTFKSGELSMYFYRGLL